LTLEHLGGQVVGNMTVVAVEGGDEGAGVLPRSDSPAMYKPAAQPSVRSARRSTSSAVSCSPIEMFNSAVASSSVNCRSATRISVSSPLARILARGNGGSARVDSAT
jgi:hypothetical protein